MTPMPKNPPLAYSLDHDDIAFASGLTGNLSDDGAGLVAASEHAKPGIVGTECGFIGGDPADDKTGADRGLTRSTTRSSSPKPSTGISLFSLPNTVTPIFFTMKRSPSSDITPTHGPAACGVDREAGAGLEGAFFAGLATVAGWVVCACAEPARHSANRTRQTRRSIM
ncbi:hypothetical protein ACU4GH_22940 [Bradyrhizobium betae]